MHVRTIIAAAAVFAAMELTTVWAQQPPARQGQPPAQSQSQPPSQPQSPPGGQPQPTSQPPAPTPQQPLPGPTGATGTTMQAPSGTVGAQPAAPVPPCAPPDMSTPVALLDRMQRILDDATKDSLGKVSLDRSGVDELRAEIAQVRASIAPVKQQ